MAEGVEGGVTKTVRMATGAGKGEGCGCGSRGPFSKMCISKVSQLERCPEWKVS